MKASIFTKAWQLFKMYNITFSQALIKAWSDYKRSLLVAVYNKIPSTRSFTKKKAEAKLAWQKFTEVNFRMERRNIIENSGARFFYDAKTFNAD